MQVFCRMLSGTKCSRTCTLLHPFHTGEAIVFTDVAPELLLSVPRRLPSSKRGLHGMLSDIALHKGQRHSIIFEQSHGAEGDRSQSLRLRKGY